MASSDRAAGTLEALALLARDSSIHRALSIVKRHVCSQILWGAAELVPPRARAFQCEAELIPRPEAASFLYKPCDMSWMDAMVCFAHICAKALEEWDRAAVFPPIAWLALEWQGLSRFEAPSQMVATWDESGNVVLQRVLPRAEAFGVAFVHAGGIFANQKTRFAQILRGVTAGALLRAAPPEEDTASWYIDPRFRQVDLTLPSRDSAARRSLCDLLSVDASRPKRLLYGWRLRPVSMPDYSRREVSCVPTKPMLFCPLSISPRQESVDEGERSLSAARPPESPS
jgi:hypothetical protein